MHSYFQNEKEPSWYILMRGFKVGFQRKDRQVKNVTLAEVKKWPCVELLRGIRMTYKGREMFFPKVYFGESEMGDFDIARASIEYKEAPKEQQESVAFRKAMTLCSRILLSDGYAAEDTKIQEDYAVRERKRKKIQKKIEKAEDAKVKEQLEAELAALPSLKFATRLFPTDEQVLSFGVEHMSGEKVRPVDNIRLVQAYQELNLFDQEEVEDFLIFPGA